MVLVDFDGTASLTDVGGELLDHFAADASWQVIDNDYVNGRVGSRAAYRLAEGLLRHDPAEWLAFALERAQLDPGFRRPGRTVPTAAAGPWRSSATAWSSTSTPCCSGPGGTCRCGPTAPLPTAAG